VTSHPGESLETDTSRQWQRRRSLWVAGIIAAVVLVVAVVVFGETSYQRPATGEVANARAGDCVRSDVGQDPPYRLAPCGAADAEFTVLRMLPSGTGAQQCPLVPGAALWFTADDRIACLGKKGVDPATAVNVAQEGDCLHFDAGGGPTRGEPMRVSCSDPRADYTLIRRLLGVANYGSPCAAVPGTTRRYGWNWINEDAAIRSRATIDVLLCLGPSESAKAAAAASKSAEAAATNRCRFVTIEEMSAAVSRATGDTYIAVSAVQTESECAYRFDENSSLRTSFTPSTYFRPGSADQTLTVDGLRAIYGPGEGTRALSVFLPQGQFSVVAYTMKGIGDTAAKKIGTEVFRVARPRLS
jgi:hypothetical protein